MLAAIVPALTLLLAGSGSAEAEVAAMTPREKAEAVVVAGMPAGDGFGGVLVRQWNADAERPRRAIVFADQEGGTVKTFRALAPWRAASQYRSAAEAFRAGRETATAAPPRRRARHLRARPRPRRTGRSARASSRSRSTGSRSRAGSAAPPASKHFPGLGSTAKSTDVARVYGVLRSQDLAPFRGAIRAGVPCVMVGHAIYPRLGPRRASFEPKTYELLRRLGFRGVAITDSIGVLGSPYAPFWARLALRAGADMVLTTSARDARRIVDALVPLARAGELDAKLVRISRYRRAVAAPSR